MRKGAKRKAATKDGADASKASSSSQDNHKEEQQQPKQQNTKAPRAKRVKVAKPEAEPEYFEDQRSLEDLWKVAFPVGTEWDQLDSLYQFKWDFSNLEDAFEEGGKLHGEKVYLFGCTERKFADLDFIGLVCWGFLLSVLRNMLPGMRRGIILFCFNIGTRLGNWNQEIVSIVCFKDSFYGLFLGKVSYLYSLCYPFIKFSRPAAQLVPYKGENKLICIPVVVAVVSPFPPSDKMGINSVQREAEEIIPMKEMKMDWVPYIPLEKRDRQVERLKSQIYILGCTQRRSALRHLKLDRLKKYEYCLPLCLFFFLGDGIGVMGGGCCIIEKEETVPLIHLMLVFHLILLPLLVDLHYLIDTLIFLLTDFYQPFKEDEFEQSTEVQIMYPLEPPVVCSFDWELDELEEFTDDLVKEEALTEDQKDAFKEFVKEKVREAKKANREAREARKKAIEEMSEETKAAFDKMRFYKFYPVQTPDTPDISNVKKDGSLESVIELALQKNLVHEVDSDTDAPFINRYYGKAHEEGIAQSMILIIVCTQITGHALGALTHRFCISQGIAGKDM
ncbi:hypothetical protein Pint_26798 [Pistacia integerrima]|uniref:Uncharacterized protein n=1 Tax=Pistacia integerrima TaxID=434235 RepID=A0ACC0YQS5_9ROSI|nr:hypothetical protein Pint_26798 [Pistacia integerrima]